MRLDATAHEDLWKYYPDEMEHNSDLWYFSDQQFTKSNSSEIDFDNLFFVDNLIIFQQFWFSNSILYVFEYIYVLFLVLTIFVFSKHLQ